MIALMAVAIAVVRICRRAIIGVTIGTVMHQRPRPSPFRHVVLIDSAHHRGAVVVPLDGGVFFEDAVCFAVGRFPKHSVASAAESIFARLTRNSCLWETAIGTGINGDAQ